MRKPSPEPQATPLSEKEIAALAYAREFVRGLQTDAGLLSVVLGSMSPLDPRAGHVMMQAALKRIATHHGWRGMLLVIDIARAGVVDAQDALDDLANDYLHARQSLPPSLVDYIMRGRPKGAPARVEWSNSLADAAMAALVQELIERFDLKPTRDKSLRGLPYKFSASAITAMVFAEAGARRGAERAVEKVWQKIGAAMLAAPRLEACQQIERSWRGPEIEQQAREVVAPRILPPPSALLT